MKKLLLLLVAASLVFGGCGGDDDSRTTVPNVAKDTPPTETATLVPTQPADQSSPTSTATTVPTARAGETPLPTPTQIPFVSVNPNGNCRTDIEAGVAVLLYGSDPNIHLNAPPFLDRLAHLCVNAFNLTFPIYQDSHTASEVKRGAETPSDETLCVIMTEAEKRGFLVTLRPSLDEQSLVAGGWRGSIKPENVSAWFHSHRILMYDYARLAEQCGGDIISIGFEFNSMEKYTDEWVGTINGIRDHFSLGITYAGNWEVREQVEFWDKLDVIGVDMFAGINVPNGASVNELVAVWQSEPYFEALRYTASRSAIPVVLAEIGATAQPGSHRRPWVWDHNTPADLEAQRRFYEAACRVYDGVVDGIYWWHYGFFEPSDPENDPTFNVMGKTAEEEIRRCYTAR